MMDPASGGKDAIIMSSEPELESIKKKELFTCAMKGRWEQVMEIYIHDRRAHKARITRSGDTALHLAVSEGKDVVVSEMVKSIKSYGDQRDVKDALQTRNNRSNTALHLAATMGYDTICEIIARVEPSLVDCRNSEGETPLYLAALFGRKQAFLLLHYIRHRIPGVTGRYKPPYYANCRREDGSTILHCAINGDYFDLAFQIIHLYGDLVTSVNENGLSPLHLLAAKPSAFKSGSRFGRIEMIIFHCLYVDKLKEAGEPRRLQMHTAVKDDQSIQKKFPPNYHVFGNIFNVIKHAVRTALGKANVPQANNKDPEKAKENHNAASGGPEVRDKGSGIFPANYRTCINFIKFFYLALLVILGQGSTRLNKIRRKKENHTWSVQIMKELLNRASDYEYEDNGSKPDSPIPDEEMSPFGLRPSTAIDSGVEDSKKGKKETPMLIAAKNGVIEMVKEILRLFPVAIYDENEEKKNIVLLAVEKRQPHVYLLLLEKNFFKESLFRQVDIEGNSALHLAAKRGEHEPWRISGAALQMQWEIKWYEFVKNSMPPHFFVHYNKRYRTAKQIFTETHSSLVQSGGEWLTKTSESCSVVATLVATVAFTSSTAVPGGLEEESGRPLLRAERAFDLFTFSSLVALCFSIISTIMFLSILTSRYQEFDFNRGLPKKLILGMSSLFMSIASMLVSFCAGHFFVLKEQFQHAALPIYLLTSFPVTLFALAQFPLYFDLLKTTLKKVPQRSYKATPVMEHDSETKNNKKDGE